MAYHNQHIVNCKCQNDYQDKMSGKGQRVANPIKEAQAQSSIAHVRCTVCNALHQVNKT